MKQSSSQSSKSVLGASSASASSSSSSKATNKKTSSSAGSGNSRDRERRKYHHSSENSGHNTGLEKSSPSKESNFRQYAGIDIESLCIYAEQSAHEHLSEEVANLLTEDINYKLRYLINDALLKSRLSGKKAPHSYDFDQSFKDLNIDHVYGATTTPNWLALGSQNLIYLDDPQVNLWHLAESDSTFLQAGDTVLKKQWYPATALQPSDTAMGKSLRNYFMTMCQMAVNKDAEVRAYALKNIKHNPRIGPITGWFYNFGYILLSKDITYDRLTLYALDLIRTLEMGPACRMDVPEKQLKLLIRLILQRLLKSVTTDEVLKPLCSILSLLCARQPLREFVITKMIQKIPEINQIYVLSFITTINALGAEAIKEIFLPHMDFFLSKFVQKREIGLTFALLELFHLTVREGLMDLPIYNAFYEVFGEGLVLFPDFDDSEMKAPQKEDFDFIEVKKQLFKTMRTSRPTGKKSSAPKSINEVFEHLSPPLPRTGIFRRIKHDNRPKVTVQTTTRNDYLVIGRTSLLLPVLRQHNKTNIYMKQHHSSHPTLLTYSL